MYFNLQSYLCFKNTCESKIEKFSHRYTEFIRSLVSTLSDLLTDQHCRSTGWSQYDTNPF